jgi:hypothetical protein
MPFDLVQTDVQLALRDKLSALRRRLHESQTTSHPNRQGRLAGVGTGSSSEHGKDAEIQRLEGELADAQRALKEQERLVEAYLHHSAHNQPLRWSEDQGGGAVLSDDGDEGSSAGNSGQGSRNGAESAGTGRREEAAEGAMTQRRSALVAMGDPADVAGHGGGGGGAGGWSATEMLSGAAPGFADDGRGTGRMLTFSPARAPATAPAIHRPEAASADSSGGDEMTAAAERGRFGDDRARRGEWLGVGFKGSGGEGGCGGGGAGEHAATRKLQEQVQQVQMRWKAMDKDKTAPGHF